MNKKILSLFVTIQIFALAKPAGAAQFNPHHIISDFEMTNHTSLGLAGIQKFLESRRSFLATFLTEDVDGGRRSAAEMIFLAANRYLISPKFILVTLQKEQSVVEDDSPTQYQLDWATGYGRCDDLSVCGPDSPRVQKFKGFAKQIDNAAGAMRFFIENPHKSNFKVGQTSNIDGEAITPANQATANLYTYTPHLHGNENFWKIWQRWFEEIYPDGTLLSNVETKEVYLIQDGVKRKIDKSVVNATYSMKNIIAVDKITLENYPDGRPIKFNQYSLLRDESGKIYLLVDDQLRHILNEKVFQNIGFTLDEVIKSTAEDLKEYPIGPAITLETVYPTGALLQDRKTGGVYYVQNGTKHPIWAPELLKANFSSRRKIVVVGADVLAQYPTGQPIRFKDGELVKSATSSAVYVISKGTKRAVMSGEAFLRLGYKWENIITTSDKVLTLHADGTPIE